MLWHCLLRTRGDGMIEASARDAWSTLDAKLRPFVARRVRSAADVDDIVQEVFLRMHRGIAQLRDDERFGPWIYQVARNAVADHQRTVARHPPSSGEGLEVAEPTPEDAGRAEEELAACVAMFVAMLPSPYREALTLTELEERTQREAAEMVGISLSGMKSRVQRGREQLRAALNECCRIDLDVRGRVLTCEPRADGPLPRCRCS